MSLNHDDDVDIYFFFYFDGNRILSEEMQKVKKEVIQEIKVTMCHIYHTKYNINKTFVSRELYMAYSSFE
jgi:hypothetical protein